MNSNGSKPVEDEIRSSKLYQTLKDSGLPAADKIAQGLGQAAQELDQALESVAPVVKQEVNKAESYYRTYMKNASVRRVDPAAARRVVESTQQPNGGYVHRYTVYPQNQPQGQPPQQNRQPVQEVPDPRNAGKAPEGVRPAPAPQMKVVYRGSPMKYYLTSIAAFLYATNMPLYEPWHYLTFLVVMALVFFTTKSIFRGKKEWVPVAPAVAREKRSKKKKEAPQPAEPEKKEEKPSQTGNPEVDKIIDEGRNYLKKLREANDAIPDEALTEDITRMEKASADIFRYIADHPQKAPQIRKFMNYYLPTTLKLLNSYQRLAAQSVRGENISSTMFNIAGMMHTVADAFEKQLDSLFTDEAMDISADISVFETMLKQEGFVEEKEVKK